MPRLEHVRIVVRELFADGDVADGLDPDASALDDRIAMEQFLT